MALQRSPVPVGGAGRESCLLQHPSISSSVDEFCSSLWGFRHPANSINRSAKSSAFCPLERDRRQPRWSRMQRSLRNLSRLGVTDDVERQVAFYCLGVAANKVFIENTQKQIISGKPMQRRLGTLGRMHTAVGVVGLAPRVPLWPSRGPARDMFFASLGAIFAFLFAGLVSRIWAFEEHYTRVAALERGGAMMPEMGLNLGQKESVEWVNMLIEKIWKVYRRALEDWLASLLQPAIDKLGKPDYVKRVEISELNLDYEPISVRKVRRRASRRPNDLQYHFGLRYTGGAKCLLNLDLAKAGLRTAVPVGVYKLDVDAELWVKLRLAPEKPYVGTLSIAFVRLPTIKLVLAPFRIVNLFAIPFFSQFLSKLLTIDLPRLLVLPRHITFDFLPQGQQDPLTSTLVDLLKNEPVSDDAPVPMEPAKAFVGELSVTVCEAKNLPIQVLMGWSNPYCVLSLGDQMIESKRNKETSHPSGYRSPVWNQDFQFLVKDPRKQKLVLQVRDSSLTLNPSIGNCEIPLAGLQDCVPRTHWLSLTRDGAFGPKKISGKLRLICTYKPFVEEENDDPASPYIKVFTEDSMEEDLEQVGIHPREDVEMSTLAQAMSMPAGHTWERMLVPDADEDADRLDRTLTFSPPKVLVTNAAVSGEQEDGVHWNTSSDVPRALHAGSRVKAMPTSIQVGSLQSVPSQQIVAHAVEQILRRNAKSTVMNSSLTYVPGKWSFGGHSRWRVSWSLAAAEKITS